MKVATRSRNWTSSGESSKSIALSPLEILEDGGRPLAAADAHGDHAVSRSAAPHLAQELDSQLRAGRAQRMAERYRAAVHVDPLLAHAELSPHRPRLRGEGLV